jgi:hypothetical protein
MSEATDRYLKALARHLPRRQRRRVLTEIRFHIREAIQTEQEHGATQEVAEEVVLERLGPAAELATQFSGAEEGRSTRARVVQALIALPLAVVTLARSIFGHLLRNRSPEVGAPVRAGRGGLPAVTGLARLAVRRVRARPLAVGSTLVALVIAAGLVGWTSLSVAVAQENSVRLRLSALPPQERALRVVYYTTALSPDLHRSQVAKTVASYSALTSGPHRATVFHPIAPEDQRGTSFVVANERNDVTVTAGRLPRGACTLTHCEALALSGRLRPGQMVRIGPHTFSSAPNPPVHMPEVRIEIVGVGSLSPGALPANDKLGMRQLLVEQLGSPLNTFARTYSGTTNVTTAPLDPSKVKASQLGALINRLTRTVRALDRSDTQNLLQATAPTTVLGSLEQRGLTARERLLVISGQVAALVIAFAAFVASTRRRELRLLEEQLLDLGANRFQAWSTGALEVVLPGLVAAGAVFGGLVLAAIARAPAGESEAGFLDIALPLQTVLTVAGVIVVAVGLLAISGSRQAPRRLGLGPLEAAAVAGLGVIVWQAVATNNLNASRVAARGHSPVLLLLPALTFFVSAVVLVRLLPLLVRLAERISRRAPVGARLAFLGAARRPVQAAVATTFLAVAVGAAAFSLNYRASLTEQAIDQANFATGALWRVAESTPRLPKGTAGETLSEYVRRPPVISIQPVATKNDVLPLTRYARVSGESPSPVLRMSVQQQNVSTRFNQAGVPMTLLALPADKLPDVRGWRSDFTHLPRSTLSHLLAPRPVALGGPKASRQATALRLWVKGRGFPTQVVLWLQRPSQETEILTFPRIVPPSGRWTLLRDELPPSLRGSELIGIDLNPIASQFGPQGFGGQDWIGHVQQRTSSGWSDVAPFSGWTTLADTFGVQAVIKVVSVKHGPVPSAIHFVRDGTVVSALRRNPNLPAALPVLASPSVAAAATDSQSTFVWGGGSTPIPIRIVGTTKLFPTITSTQRFIVADYNTASAFLNEVTPGIVPPTEAWFFEKQPSAFATGLAKAPFRLTNLVSEQQNEQALLSDPLASGTRSLLLATAIIAALLGLLGLLVAIRAILRDESSILAEYEALGIRPSVLARSTAIRLTAFSVIGVAAGIGGGLLAGRLVGSLVAVTGGGGVPLPPIQAVISWPSMAVLLAVVAAAAIAAALILARKTFARPVAQRLRA